MKRWDVIIIGGGVIGLSLAWGLRRRGALVLVVEKGALGRQASWAAGGMLAWCDPHLPAPARWLARLSQSLYGEFVEGVEAASGCDVDLRRLGTILLDEALPGDFREGCRVFDATELCQLEPQLKPSSNGHSPSIQFWPEWSVDPRGLMTALIALCKTQGVDVVTGSAVSRVAVTAGRTVGVETLNAQFPAHAVVNCAGAWSGHIACGVNISPSPTRPVKGHMLALKPSREVLQHVVRAPDVYLIPRSDVRIVVGATLEEAGFDTEVHPETIERLRSAAVRIVPELASASIMETWAGLRPGSPDGLPILGETAVPGYFVASGHFRDGILLAPGTASVMSSLVLGNSVDEGLSALSPKRFA